jgi:hypothetical protein
MPVQPVLLTSGGTNTQIQVLEFGSVIPPTVTITTTAAAVAGATTVPVTILPTTATLREGLILVAGTGATAQLIEVRQTTAGTLTSLPVQPLKKDLASAAVINTFAGLLLIGLESANMQLQTETNQVVLLANDGWRVTDYSTGSFEFSGNLYIPTTETYALGSRQVIDALLNKQLVYVERYLPDGTYHAGVCAVTNASDQTQGAQYVTLNVTLTGSGKPIQTRLFATI